MMPMPPLIFALSSNALAILLIAAAVPALAVTLAWRCRRDSDDFWAADDGRDRFKPL